MARIPAERIADWVEAANFEQRDPGVPRDVRQARGAIVLALAFALVVGIPFLLTTPVIGLASPIPLPLPPPIGSCVTLSSDGFAGVVTCDQPHDAEITMTWRAGQSAKANSLAEPDQYSYRVTGGTTRFVYFQCQGWNSDYVGTTAVPADQVWVAAPPIFSGGLVYAPLAERAGNLYWSACVVRPSVEGARYLGSIRDAGKKPTQPRPGEFVSCLVDPRTGPVQLIYSPCSQAHRVEPIAVKRDFSAAIEAESALGECVRLVQQLTGATDPTYGGQLVTKVQDVHSGTDAADATGTDLIAGSDDECVVEFVGGGELLGSVVGLGDASLPVQH